MKTKHYCGCITVDEDCITEFEKMCENHKNNKKKQAHIILQHELKNVSMTMPESVNTVKVI